MMKLSTLQTLGQTIGEDGNSRIAEQILAPWGFDAGSVQSFRASTNFVFRFRQDGVPRFLRFTSASEKELLKIDSEIKLLRSLATGGLRVAEPIASENGLFVETVHTEIGTYYAVVFQALSGKQMDIEVLEESQYFQWGQALGALHARLKVVDFHEISRPDYHQHLHFIREYVPVGEAEFQAEYEIIEQFLKSRTPSKENFGLIHFDFELDNLIWDADGIQMLDFDDCAYYFYAADIALALRDLFHEGVDAANRSYRTFLSGYRSVCAIDENEVATIPMFLRMRDLLGHAILLRSVDISLEETADWLKPLHRKFTNIIETYRASLKK